MNFISPQAIQCNIFNSKYVCLQMPEILLSKNIIFEYPIFDVKITQSIYYPLYAENLKNVKFFSSKMFTWAEGVGGQKH